MVERTLETELKPIWVALKAHLTLTPFAGIASCATIDTPPCSPVVFSKPLTEKTTAVAHAAVLVCFLIYLCL